MPTVTVRRDKGWADRLRKYRILIDNAEVGRIGDGAEMCQRISNGPHRIEAKIDWCGSLPLEFDAQSVDRTVVVRCALRGWRLVFGIYYIIFNRHAYLTLELKE